MKRYLIFGTTGLGLLMASLDMTMVAVAFPHLTRDLGTNILWAAWTISVYTLAMTIIMPLSGKLSDSLGHKKIFLLSMVLFTGSSVLCGLAPNIYALIFLRFLQGIGGGSFLPAATGIVSSVFPEKRQRFIGLLSSVFPVGGIVGPNLGGWIVEHYSWRTIFYINVPIGIVLLSLGWIFLPEAKKLTPLRLDYSGASILMGAMFCLMLGLNHIAEPSLLFTRPVAVIFIMAAMILVGLFLRQEKKSLHPLLDVSLLKSKPFMAANLFNMVVGATSFGVFSFIPLYGISVYHLSAFSSGAILTPRSIGGIAASAITSFLLTRWGYRKPLLWGLGIASFVTLVLGQGLQSWNMVDTMIGRISFLALLMLMSGIGVGTIMPPSNNACIELMPDKVATITGLRGMFRAVGGVVGVSVITLILHMSSDPVVGFRIAFTSCGFGMLLAAPLVFMMPDGKEVRKTDGEMG